MQKATDALNIELSLTNNAELWFIFYSKTSKQVF